MPFTPLRLLIAYDAPAAAVVPRMKAMLEERAFVVDTWVVGSGAVDLAPYRGIVLGAAGGLRGSGPSDALVAWVKAAEDFGEKKVALFSVYTAREGGALHRLRQVAESTGAEVVVAQAYGRLWPERGDHVLPAECMVRIRR